MTAAGARRSADTIPVAGAKRAAFPGFVEPCFATLRSVAPKGRNWLHEIKFDGYRVQAQLRGGRCTLYTRRGYDWTSAFRSIAEDFLALPVAEAIVDGEVVVLDAEGRSDYHKLQAELARRRTDRLTYFAFDLLYLDGFDLRDAALADRKRALAALLERCAAAGRTRYSEHFEADGPDVFAQACRMRLEGIVSKQRDSRYGSGRQKSWLKIKCSKSDSYPIVAFVEKLGARPRRIASLYVGRRDGERLVYAGKVQSGFTEAAKRDVRERLDPLIRGSSPLTVPVEKPKATWVEPELEAEVQFSSITTDGLLREAVFKGLRDDLRAAPPSERRRRAATRARRKPPRSLGVPKENILEWLPDAVVPSKDELVAYWSKVADRALPHLARRPLKLVRHVRGTTFYHMGPLPPIPASVRKLEIAKREGGEGTRLWIEDVDGLLGLVDIGAVELHPWNATVDDIEHADRLVFDLDPGDGVDWDFVVESALAMRELLRGEGLDSWAKLTGGKGIHVMAPLERKMAHDAARRYARRLAQRLAAGSDLYTLSSSVPKRAGRLFVDYLRNGRGTTAVGAWSPRARPGFPIAAPVTWRQVGSGIGPDAFTMRRPFTRARSR